MWTGYSISLRLAAPLHVGWRTFGNIRQTRPYIPGRTLWGAFTARLARDVFAKDYEKAATVVDEHVRFGYLYPAEGDPPVVACRPWGADTGEFAWRYLDSYMSTALRDGRSKLDGSLHEIECLAPYTRAGRPVWMTGPLWVAGKESSLPEALRDPAALMSFLERLVVGAERGYGWGRFRQVRLCLLKEGAFLEGSEWCWTCQGDEVLLANPNNDARLLAHLSAGNAALSGAGGGLSNWGMEPLVGRTTPLRDGHRRAGAVIAQAAVCATPGSLAAPGQRYSVGNLGVWQTSE